MLERVVTTRLSRDESSTFYCLRHPSVLLPVSVSTLDFHFRQDLRLDFHKVESSVLIDDPSQCGCIGHGCSPESRASVGDWSDFEFANAAIFIAASVLISLGYFIGLSKSSLIPAQVVKFLGFLVDSRLCAFLLPEDKKIYVCNFT